MARKWRPQVFEEVVGQDHVVKTLKNAIRLNRIAHAYIFSGPRGIGKTSVARILSKALNCEKGPTETPCNRCLNCREITEGISMDVREIDGASNRGIDEIRELRENVRFSPASSKYKIYIIDEVHMLTKEAFNALLKTIEEPPPNVLFIFATTEIHKVPATILSRCQRHDFRRVSLKQLCDHLRFIAEAEGIRIGESGLDRIAEAGDGSMRDAESIFDQVISYAGNDIKDEDVDEILGLSDRKLLYDLSEAVLRRNGKECLRIIDEAYFAGLDLKHFFQKIVRHFLNLLVIKIAGREGDSSELPENEKVRISRQIGDISRETLQRLLDILMAEEEEVRKSPDPRLNLEFVLIKMTYLDPLIPINEMISRVEDLETKLTSGGYRIQPVAENRPAYERIRQTDGGRTADEAGQAAPEKNAPPGSAPGAEDDLRSRFNDFIKRKSQPLWSKLVQCVSVHVENGRLTVSFAKSAAVVAEMIDREKLAEAAREFFGTEISLNIEILEAADGQNDLAMENGMSQNKMLQQIRREALSHPLVQKVMDLFEGAEIKEIIPKK